MKLTCTEWVLGRCKTCSEMYEGVIGKSPYEKVQENFGIKCVNYNKAMIYYYHETFHSENINLIRQKRENDLDREISA